MLAIEAPGAENPNLLSAAHPIAYDTEGARIASGLGRSTIINAMNSGELIARKSGRRVVILRSDLVEYLRSLPSRRAGAIAA